MSDSLVGNPTFYPLRYIHCLIIIISSSSSSSKEMSLSVKLDELYVCVSNIQARQICSDLSWHWLLVSFRPGAPHLPKTATLAHPPEPKGGKASTPNTNLTTSPSNLPTSLEKKTMSTGPRTQSEHVSQGKAYIT